MPSSPDAFRLANSIDAEHVARGTFVPSLVDLDEVAAEEAMGDVTSVEQWLDQRHPLAAVDFDPSQGVAESYLCTESISAVIRG